MIMLIKKQNSDFQYRVDKLQELSAMGGFPIEREVAEKAVRETANAPLPDLAQLDRESAARIAAGPAYRAT